MMCTSAHVENQRYVSVIQDLQKIVCRQCAMCRQSTWEVISGVWIVSLNSDRIAMTEIRQWQYTTWWWCQRVHEVKGRTYENL